ncbi:MAG: hypothetical protein RR925_08595, partial [Erysipelotrichaceae bacterium]
SALFAVAMVVLYFFGFCDLDLIVLLIGALVLVVALITWHNQSKKLKDLEDQKEELNKKQEAFQ